MRYSLIILIETDVNNMIDLYELAGLLLPVTTEGFSAYIPGSISVSDSTQIGNWSVDSPYFSSSNFQTDTGDYLVPVSGVYAVQATVNFSTNAITTTLGPDINPSFDIRRTSSTPGNLTSGLLPIVNLDLNLALGSLVIRAVLGNGSVSVSGLVSLSAGDYVGLFYNAGGMTVNLNLSNIVWSIYCIS